MKFFVWWGNREGKFYSVTIGLDSWIPECGYLPLLLPRVEEILPEPWRIFKFSLLTLSLHI